MTDVRNARQSVRVLIGNYPSDVQLTRESIRVAVVPIASRHWTGTKFDVNLIWIWDGTQFIRPLAMVPWGYKLGVGHTSITFTPSSNAGVQDPPAEGQGAATVTFSASATGVIPPDVRLARQSVRVLVDPAVQVRLTRQSIRVAVLPPNEVFADGTATMTFTPSATGINNGPFTLAKRGTSQSTTGSPTAWTTTANAVDGAVGVNNATYAVWTSTASGAAGFIEISGFDFSSVPAGATITSISVTLRHFENNITRIPNVAFQVYDGATTIGASFACTVATAARSDTATRNPTTAQLKSSTFKVRATATRAAVTQSATFNVDYIDVTATYTV